MSWNEPGGGKKDPWSGRDQSPETPPEIDKVIQSLQEKFGRFVGDDGPGFGGGRSLGVLFGVGLGLWALTGIYIVDEGNRGVVTRFGAYTETTTPGPHWHWPAPLESVDVINVDNQRFVEVGYRSNGGGRQQSSGSVPKEALMLTQDENIVDVRLAVQYQIRRTEVSQFKFNVADPDATLKQVTESAVRGIVGKNNMDFVLTEGRSDIARDIKNEIQQILDDYKTGISITSVNLVDAQPPDEVQGAFEDAIKAREDEQRLKNEAEAYANEVIPKARGGAARQIQEAEGYKQRVIARAQGDASRFNQLLIEYEKAPEVTRQRLYVETMESVLSGSRTVLVDSKGGNNLYYLPLDKLVGSSSEADAMPSSEAAQPSAAPTPVANPSADPRAARAVNRGREPRGR